ncbi:MAG: hypothetical protein JRH19_05890 [Deltaproteobacteria bacterium]|nr:hypothetical protein [Deltaproteobacteria bacterium]
MARWLTRIDFVFVFVVVVVTLLLAGAGSAEPVTAHSSTDDVLNGAFMGSIAEAQVGDRAIGGDYELGIGQILGAPLRSDDFEWESGATYDWMLTYVPGSFGGAVEFTFDGVSNRMGTAIPFNSFFIRASAELADTSVEVTQLSIGGPPGGGGGSEVIFETANSTEAAGASADGNDGTLDILKISNVDLASGFTLKGKARFVYENAYPHPQGAEASFQIFVAVSDPNDSDGDGIPDSGFPAPCMGGETEGCNDNCPGKGNSSQANSDEDELGDACDNCPFAFNPPGQDGAQPNEDGDIFGDACDNCPLTPIKCKPVGGGTCKIDDDTNSDTDSWGDRCDNCKKVANEDQLDSDNNGKGDLCDDNTLFWDNLFVVESVGAQESGESPAAATAQTRTTVELSMDCSTNVAFANIGINLTGTGTTFVDFSGCLDDTGGVPNPNEKLCTIANSSELGVTISTASSVIGPGVQSISYPWVAENPSVGTNPPGVPAQMVILQLHGAGGGLICSSLQKDVKLGVLRLDDFIVGSNPLSIAGFTTFDTPWDPSPDPPLTQLVGPGGTVISDEQVVFQVNPPDNPLIALQLRRAETDGDRRYELSIIVDQKVLDDFGPQKVSRIAFGLTASEPVAAGEMVFGQCDDETPLPPGSTPITGLESLLGCSVLDPDDPDLGGNVKTPTFLGIGSDGAPVVATYTVGPDAVIPAGSNRLPNTLYVALDSGFELTGQPGLNGTGTSQAIGVVAFNLVDGDGIRRAVDPPQITFQGTEDLPGYEAAPVVPASADPNAITVDNVTLINTSSSSSDFDKDGEPDDLDNCRPVKYAEQTNTGGVGFGTIPEGIVDIIGDAWQCADPGRDGVGDNGEAEDSEGFDLQDDVSTCQEALAGKELPEGQDSGFCKVTPSGGSFSIIDILVLEADTADPGSSGLGDPKTGSLQSCDAAEGNL